MSRHENPLSDRRGVPKTRVGDVQATPAEALVQPPEPETAEIFDYPLTNFTDSPDCDSPDYFGRGPELPLLSDDLLRKPGVSDLLVPLQYDREQLRIGQVHFGPGKFFKGLVAPLTHDFMQSQAPGWQNWGISVVSFRSWPQALKAQGGLYTHCRLGTRREDFRVIGSIKEALHMGAESAQVMTRLVDPSVKVVSLTISEAGYGMDRKRRLQEDHPAIAEDIQNPHSPRWAVGSIVEALRLRKEAGIPPFTVISFDNMPPNGETLKDIVLSFAGAIEDTELQDWIGDVVAFPNTMGDRITPQLNEVRKQHLNKLLGFQDKEMVLSEMHCHLVIEDRDQLGTDYFPHGKPPWPEDDERIRLTHDTTPYGLLKGRMINSSHVAIAWLASRMGVHFVHDMVSDPHVERFLRTLMRQEIAPNLMIPAEMSLEDYVEKTLERFRNDKIPDMIHRLNNDGIRKITGRILPAVRDGLEHNTPIDGLCLVVGCWLLSKSGYNENGVKIDPIPIEQQSNLALLDNSNIQQLRRNEDLFGRDLVKSRRFNQSLNRALDLLRRLPLKEVLLHYPPHCE